MKIDTIIKNRIKDNAERILEHYGAKKTGGGESRFIGLCPFHGDKNPSFSMQMTGTKKGQWICFACGVKGSDIFSFVAQRERLDPVKQFPIVAEKAAQAAGLPLDATGDNYATSKKSDVSGVNVTFAPKTAEALPPVYLNKILLSKEHPEDGNYLDNWSTGASHTELYKWLSPQFQPKDLRRVLEAYRVGGARLTNNPDYWLAFPYINAEGNCVDVHFMAYDESGHRRKGTYSQDWGLRLLSLKERRAPWCLFGEHLLAQYPDKPVAIVESEKTALIASIVKDDFIFVATGSAVNLTADRCQALKGRKCVIFPDFDQIEQWEQRAAELNKHGFKIASAGNFIRDNATGEKDDLADIIINNLTEIYGE